RARRDPRLGPHRGRRRRPSALRGVAQDRQLACGAAAALAGHRAERDARRRDAPLTSMQLAGLQNLLRDFYALEMPYEVDDFLTTDATLASALDARGRRLDEKLLIAEQDGEAEVSLYLEQGLLDRLARSDPLEKLGADNLEDFWTAFEGVSHFTYYAWNA